MDLRRRSRLGVLTAAAIAATQALAAAPALAGEPAVGLTDTNQLVFFDTDTPGTIARTIAITGLAPTEGLLAIDFRPGGGTDALARQLYAISAMSRVYTIDLYTGAATAVPATPGTPPVGSTGTNPLSPLLTNPVAGFDFNPQADRLRIVTDAEQNLRLVPNPIATFTDTTLTGNNEAAAAAYTENHPAARSTTLFTIDAGTDTLVRQGVAGGGNVPATDGPNGGVGTTIGALGVDTAGAATSFDIAAGGGRAFAGLTPPAGMGTTSLYSVDLGTGAATAVGAIGGGHTIRGLALAPGGAAQFALAGSFTTEDGGPTNVVLTRSGGDLRPVRVNYIPLPFTASPADFTLQAGSVSFAAGETSKTISVSVTDDALAEPPEAFLMTLFSSEVGSVLGARTTSVVTIVDDEAAPAPPDKRRLIILASPSVPVNISALLTRKRLTALVSCSEECSVQSTLKAGGKTIAKGSGGFSSAGTVRVWMTINKAGRALLRKERRSRKRTALRMSLSVVGLDGEGDIGSSTSRVLLPRR